jgi:hypothetical protein
VQELLHLQRLEFLLYLIVDILVPGETRTYVKTDTNTWSIEGNQGSNNRTFTGTTTLRLRQV